MNKEEQRVLRWSKAAERGDGWSPIYEGRDKYGVGATAVRTGRYGSDDYPWDWSAYPLHEPPEGVRVRYGGAADTLRSAKDQAEQAARLTRADR